MFVLAWIRRIYKALSADASPSAIAFAAALGLTAGCVPLRSGLTPLLLLLILVFRVQISSAILFWVIGAAVRAGGGAHFFLRVGEGILENDGLKGFWTWFLNLPVVAWTGLEHYAILGGAVVGLVAGALLFVPIRGLVTAYRRWAHEKVSKNRFFRWVTNLWLVRILRFILIGAKA